MNRKRKPPQRKRANKKIDRPRNSRLGKHQLDVRVKRRAGALVRRHFRIPVMLKIAAVVAALVVGFFVSRNVLGRFLWNNPAYTLTTIDFETDGWLTRPIALETAAVTTGINVLRLDLEDIRDRLVALPQVKDATVVRVLPDKLGLSVKERHPIAWLSCPEQNIYPKVKSNGFLLDEEGVALPCKQMRREYVNFPVIDANGLAAIKPGQPIGSSYQLDCALELVCASREILYDKPLEIVEIKLVNDYSLLARLNNHTKVTFKSSEILRRKDIPSDMNQPNFLNRIEQQVQDLVSIYDSFLMQNKRLATVNLLPDRNIAVTFAEERMFEHEASSDVPQPRPVPLPAAEDGVLEAPPPRARRAVRALRSIPKERASAATPAMDPDLHSILNQQ